MIEKKIGVHKFLVEFEDKTQMITTNATINSKLVKNPYFPNVCGIGCMGRIDFKKYIKLYHRWELMIDRCYNSNNCSFKNYGKRNIKISSVLICFEDYFNYMSTLENFDLLLKGNNFTYDIDRINNNEDYKEGNLRIVTRSENCLNRNNNILIKVIFPNGNVEIGNMSIMCKKYNFDHSNIRKCISGERKTHKSCKFIKMEDFSSGREEE